MDEALTATGSDQAAADAGRVRRVAARFRAALRVEGVLGALLPGEPALKRLFRSRAAADGRFTLLTGLAPQSPEFVALLESLERVVNAREKRLVVLDDEVHRDRFEECLQGTAFERAALADYVSLLCRATRLDPPTCDRIRTLVSEVVRRDAEGRRDPAALRELLPPTAIPAGTAESAVAWLQAASVRAAEATSLEALIEAGFFLEVRSYESSLGPTLLDPGVMAASLELAATIAETIGRQAKDDASEDIALRRHLALVEDQVQARLDGQLAPGTLARRRYRRRAPPAPARRKSSPAGELKFTAQRTGKWPKGLTYSRGAGAVLMVAVAVLVVQLSGGQSLTGLDTDQLSAITPFLTEASLVPAERPQTLIGRFDGVAWQGTSVQDREIVARELAVRITARGLTSATVLVGETVVVQIENGRVLVVE